MTELLMDWPSPDVLERSRRRRLVLGWLGLALVSLVAAMALVHGFDVVSQNASVAQLALDGPVYSTACTACDRGFSVPLPDWRSLSVSALALAAAAAGRVGLRR